VPIERLAAVRVTTSGRRVGRTQRGLAVDLRRNSWLAERNYRAGEFTLQQLLAVKDRSVSVILPTREVASTLPHILDALQPLHELIDELLVVDADSTDGTAEIAHRRGVWVQSESALQRQFGPALGKGDAMWRALSATSGEIVCFLDADTEDFDTGFALGMLGPLLTHPELAFVKGHFQRPFRVGDTTDPHGGGRVTELLARPYLNLHFPELAGFRQPLAGELAATRSLLEQLPFPVGYGVEIANLIDAHRLVGLERTAQVDLGTRQNRHQPLHALSRMALEVLAAAEQRTHASDAVPGPLLVPIGDDFEVRAALTDERPPLVTMH
jgi:glucosyl-3-phosphoglycerate synthase